MKVRKTVLIALFSIRQECIYYKSFDLDTEVSNGLYHIEKYGVSVYVDDLGQQKRSIRQLKADEGGRKGYRIYESDTTMIDHHCKELFSNFDEEVKTSQLDS